MEIQVRTVVIGCSFGGGDASTRIDIPDTGVTAHILIKKKVERDVAEFNRNRNLLHGREYRMPEEMIRDENEAADPSRHGRFEARAWEPEVERAVAAWREGTFRIIVDDRTISSLDEEIELEPDSDVVFMRLMPFISG